MTLIRHSSRRVKLDQNVFQQRLDGAASYDRIAGYFRSSLFEVAGEALKSVAGKVRIVCNSDLDAQDVVTAAAAQAALRRSWCEGRPEDAPPEALPRYQALYEALSSGKMEVRVYDYVDEAVPMLSKMYRKRIRGYTAVGYSIKDSLWRGNPSECNEPTIA